MEKQARESQDVPKTPWLWVPKELANGEEGGDEPSDISHEGGEVAQRSQGSRSNREHHTSTDPFPPNGSSSSERPQRQQKKEPKKNTKPYSVVFR